MRRFNVLSGVIFFLVYSLSLNPLLLADGSTKSNASILEDEELTQALAGLEEEEIKVPELPMNSAEPSILPDVKKSKEPAAKKTVQKDKLTAEAPVDKDEFGIPVARSKKAKEKKKLNSGFSFVEQLEEAEVQLLNSEREIEASGKWSGNAFTFSSVKNTGIKTDSLAFGAQTEQAIAVSILPKHVYQLRFRNVAPFEKLRLQYSLKETYQGKAPVYLSLRILAGNHELKRIQVSSKDPWVKQTFNLGVVSFLNSDIPILFEFSTSQGKGLTLYLIAKTE